MLILGLSEKNLELIKAGKPLVLSERTNAPKGSMPHPNYVLVIISGKDELAIKEMFEKDGLITVDTQIHVDPRL